MNNKHTLLFDYGGTLDTGGHHWGQVIWQAYEQLQINVDYQQYRKAYVETEQLLGREPIIKPETTFRELLQEKITRQIEMLGADMNRANEMVEILYQHTKEQTEHSRKVITRLKNNYPTALVSNFYGNLTTVLREFQLDNLFDLVIESAVVGIRKPDPNIFRLTIQQMKTTPEQTIVIGDSIKNDIRPAKMLGFKTIWIKGMAWNETPEDETLPDEIIYNIEQLEQTLKTNP